jgi:uncharacterized membrane protein
MRPTEAMAPKQPTHDVSKIFSPVILILLPVTAAAIIFIYRSVLPYYLNFNSDGLGVYWTHRVGLLLHISAGSASLLIGPFQLWSGLRNRFRRAHRWTGRVYLAVMALSVCAAVALALTPSYGWIYGLGLGLLAFAWSAACGVAYYAIRQGNIALHRRWMIRAYVINFAFVFYRATEIGLVALGIGSESERNIVEAWTCWTVPLVLTLVVEGLIDARQTPGNKVRN